MIIHIDGYGFRQRINNLGNREQHMTDYDRFGRNILKKRFIQRKYINALSDNRGTTMIETLVSFVVLAIILAALYGMIRLATNMRIRAMDSESLTSTFNSEIYKNTDLNGVDEYYYFGDSKDSSTMFMLKVEDKTNDRNLVTDSTSSVDKDLYKDPIRLTKIDGIGYVSTDSRIESDNLVPPKVLVFKYHE